MLDGNSAAELTHDRAGVDPAPYLAAALDSVIETLMVDLKPARAGFARIDLQDFLTEQSDLAELLVQYWGDFDKFKDEIERRLRSHLQNHEIVAERADDLAREAEEDAGCES